MVRDVPRPFGLTINWKKSKTKENLYFATEKERKDTRDYYANKFGNGKTGVTFLNFKNKDVP